MLESVPFTRFLGALRGPLSTPGASRSALLPCCFRLYYSNAISYGQAPRTFGSSSNRSHGSSYRSSGASACSLMNTFSPSAPNKAGRKPVQRWRAGFEQKRWYSKTSKSDGQFGEMTEEQYATSQDRFTKRSAKTIHKIFGPGMTTQQGNQLLNTIQKQRVTGTLDMDISGPSVTNATVAKALAWLRQNYPLDEDAAIMARLEREEAVIRDWKPQQDANPDNVWGESELDRVRAKNIAEAKAREEAEKAEAAKLEQESGGKSGPLAVNRVRSFKELSRPRETKAWVQKYREKAALSTEDTPPTPHPARVLIPTGLFAAAIVILCVAFAAEYEAPARAARMFPEIPPAAATVGALIGINLLVFLCWRVPFLWRTMNMNMLMIAATPSPVALLGNIFSHQGIGHLALNMTGLWFIGTALHDEVGRGRFLAIYIATGVLGSYASLLRFVIMNNYTFTTLGASGALFGIMGAYCGLQPDAHVSFAFLPTDWQKVFFLRADWCFWFLFIWEFMAIVRRSFSVDHVAHFGGMLSGVFAAEAVRRQARRRRRRFANQTPITGTTN